jgi:Fe-S oxidoreductase
VPNSQRWFSPKEVAAVIGKTDQYVRNAFDNQKILGHLLNGNAPIGAERRCTYMISRESILLFLFETANFSPEDFLERLCEVLENRSLSQLLKIQKVIDEIVSSRSTTFYSNKDDK